MAVKCKINAKSALLPVPGTEADGKGQCPECLTPERKLTGKGFVGAHNVVLGVDTTIPVTDEGLRVGAPRDAAVKREIEARQMRAGTRALPMGGVPEPVFTTGHGRGPVLVKGRDTVPRLREAGLSWAEATDLRQDGSVRMSTTLDQPLGRERFDRKITDVPEPAPRLSKSQKRNARRKRCHAAYGASVARAAGK